MDLRGSFGGIVEDNRDPQKLGRLKVRVPHVYGAVGSTFGAVTTNDIPWALPVGLPNGLTQQSGGADWLPEIGDQVLVNFLDGEPEKPVWQWFMQTQKASEDFKLHDYATGSGGSVGKPKRGAWVRYGHTVEWNTDGLILTTSKGYRLLLTDASAAGNDGDISLATQGGQLLELDDSTGDGTLNVSNDFNLNVGQQVLVLADSFSLTTFNQEIELISGEDFVIDVTNNLDVSVGEDWNVDVTGKMTFDLHGQSVINVSQKFELSATADLSLKSSANAFVDAQGALNLSSTGVLSVSTKAAMNLDFSQLALGVSATSPFVLGDQLLSYLTALYTALLSHTHSGVFPGPSVTSPMLPPPPPPGAGLLSLVIRGK